METPRLRLASWHEDRVADFLAIASDPEVMRHIGPGQPWDEARVRAFVQRQIDRERTLGFCLWALIERASGRLVGHTGLAPLGDSGEIEIGWWLARREWGRGLATEAGRRVIDFAFDELRLPRIVSIAQPANTASTAVMERLGMRFVRRARHGDFGLANPDIELVLYALDNPAPP